MSENKFIPLNKPFYSGREFSYIQQAMSQNKISGNGVFTKKCHHFFEENLNFKKVLLTTSCTDALEMAALLIKISPGDEVIVPSFTFPSTANAFILRGAKIVFADSEPKTPNIDASKIRSLITNKTKAIIPVHYAGMACDMDVIMQIAKDHNLFVVEDAAHAIDSYYKKRLLGQIGHLATFSFHESKNISSGEGGLLAINDKKFIFRSEILWEKGTNRLAFFRGEINKYRWVDIGSSFLPSDVTAALLYAQLEELETIQRKRIQVWNHYFEDLTPLAKMGYFSLPQIPPYATNNAHLFYILCRSQKERHSLMEFLKTRQILAIFHYLALHRSPFYRKKHDGRKLPFCDFYSRCLLRLPLYCDLSSDDVTYIIQSITDFYQMSTRPAPNQLMCNR
jgi:dTDP-4-amino-4,6-dideoxygalactose transaminase